MRRYATLKKEFEFLVKTYGFEICLKQKHGAYYFIEWTNQNISIMALYDERVEDPITIRIYDADSLGTAYDAVEYKNEFEQRSGSPREKIRRAAEWLSTAIANKHIIVQSGDGSSVTQGDGSSKTGDGSSNTRGRFLCVTEIQNLEKVRRDLILKKLRQSGISIRQISRLTGVSFNVVRKF